MAASGRNLLQFLPILRRRASVQVCKRCAKVYSTVSQQTSTSEDPFKWQLYSAVCLEQYPIITQEKNDIETKYQNMMNDMELERSLLSDHELQIIKDEAKKKRMQAGEEDIEEEDMKEKKLLTAYELEDKWQAELNKFTPASRYTDADKENDRKSTKQKLDRKLVLIVKQMFGNDEQWVLPMGARNEGESMREAAERALKSTCGEIIQTTFIGNAPCGYYKYKLPKTNEREYYGSKIFFFKACYNGGGVSIKDESVTDYKWVTHDEIHEYLSPMLYKKVNEFLLDF